MNSFKLFGLKRTRLPDGQELAILCRVEDFFELHSRATGRKKQCAKGKFFSQLKSLNKFYA